MKIKGQAFRKAADLAALLGLILTVLAYAGRFDWALDALTHLRPQLALAFLLYLPIPLLSRHWRIALLALIALLSNLLPFAGILLPGRPKGGECEGGLDLRILQANILTSNTEYDKLLSLIHREDPDIILLQEPDQTWLNHLSVLHSRYPVRAELARNDNYGIAVFAKGNRGKGEILFLDDPIQAPVGRLILNIGNQTLTCFSIHAPAPYDTFTWEGRNQFQDELALLLQKTQGPLLITGDFNNTPYAESFRAFTQKAGVRDSTGQFGLHPTWPSFLPAPLRIQLDQCLHSPDISVISKRNGPDIGSDHLPLIIEIALPISASSWGKIRFSGLSDPANRKAKDRTEVRIRFVQGFHSV